MYVRIIAHILTRPEEFFRFSLKRHILQVVLCLRDRRLCVTVSGRRVENPDLLGNDFDDRPLLPIAILPIPALELPLDEGVPSFGQESGTTSANRPNETIRNHCTDS